MWNLSRPLHFIRLLLALALAVALNLATALPAGAATDEE
jgi:hypothetical protein